MRNHERGASIWPFVITLVLLLIAVFLWYSGMGDNDKLTKQVADLRLDVEKITAQASKAEEHNERVAEVVGFQSQAGTNSKLWVNVDDLKKALDPTVAGSMVAQFIEATKVKTTKAFYANKKMPNPPAAVELATLPPAFKDKVNEAREAFPKEAPMKPDDDDAPAMAKYQADLEAYNKAFEAYRAKIDELVAMKDEFKKYTPVLGAPVLYDPDKMEAVIWEFFPRPPVAQITVEEFFKLPTPVVKDIVAALDEKSKGYQSQLDTITAAKLALEKVVDNSDEASKGLNQQLAEAQTARTTDVAKLTKESTDAMAKLEEARVALTSAQNTLAQTQETSKTEKAKDKQSIDALEQSRRMAKEKYDFEIQRNDPDGSILTADNALQVVYIDRGSSDKVYPGLVFGVSYIGRGAIRSPKGEIVVTKVLDAHYSQARIRSTVLGEKPMVTGDLLANPFFDGRKPVHVYLAGPLRKFPKEIAIARLKQMGAIVVDQLDASTDLILIPDSVAAKLKGSDTPPAEGEPAPAAEESEFDRLTRLAKSFGATVVTERMIESFFDY